VYWNSGFSPSVEGEQVKLWKYSR